MFLTGMMVVVISGCTDRMNLEDAAFSLLMGYDLDEEDNLTVYVINPIFGENTRKDSQELATKTETLRLGREVLDTRSSGQTVGTKLYILLVGKHLLQHEDWFHMLDNFYRDPKNSISAKVVVSDKPLSEMIFLDKKDHPLLPHFLRELVESKSARLKTVNTNLKELHRQMYEKGITPALSEIDLNDRDEIIMKGTALLDKKGKFTVSLNNQESALLQILQKTSKTADLTVSIPDQPKNGIFTINKVSFTTDKTKTKIRTSWQENKYRFDIQINMSIVLTELLFPYDVESEGGKMNQIISDQLQTQFENMIKKFQRHKVDPVGLGLYARAYYYEHYKRVEDHWGETLADADVKVSVKAAIKGIGATI